MAILQLGSHVTDFPTPYLSTGISYGVPNHVTRDHYSGVNGDGQTCGTDRDHLRPARAANRQSSGVGGSFVFVHNCAIVTAVGHQCQAP